MTKFNKPPTCHPERRYHAKDQCKECYEKARATKYYKENKTEMNKRSASWREKNKEKASVWQRKHKLWELYRLTPEEWETIFQYQGGVCAITGKTGKKRLSTDHDHSTGKVRGLLAFRVNRALSAFNDDPALLRKAADYLEKPPAVQALGRVVYGVLGQAKHKKKMVYGSETGPIKPENKKASR